MGGHFTRRMKNRRFRMKSEEQKEIERIEQLKRNQTQEQETRDHERDRED